MFVTRLCPQYDGQIRDLLNVLMSSCCVVVNARMIMCQVFIVVRDRIMKSHITLSSRTELLVIVYTIDHRTFKMETIKIAC